MHSEGPKLHTVFNGSFHFSTLHRVLAVLSAIWLIQSFAEHEDTGKYKYLPDSCWMQISSESFADLNTANWLYR